MMLKRLNFTLKNMIECFFWRGSILDRHATDKGNLMQNEHLGKYLNVILM